MAFWSSEEDDVVRTYFPKHGQRWPGWSEVLPGRSWDSIRTRAYRVFANANVGDAVTVDAKLKRLMESGLSMSQIDSLMGWPPNQTKKLLMQSWERV